MKYCQYEIEQSDRTIPIKSLVCTTNHEISRALPYGIIRKALRFKKLRKNTSRNWKEILPNYKGKPLQIDQTHMGQNLRMKLAHFWLSLRYIELLGRIVFAR